MKQVECTIEIDAPIEKVFALFTDFKRLPYRIPKILRVEMLTPGPVAVGTQFRETRKVFGTEATEVMTVTSLLPNQELSMSSPNCGIRSDCQFRFEPHGDGTKVHVLFAITPENLFAKIMWKAQSFFMKGMMVKMIREDMECIKKSAEA